MSTDSEKEATEQGASPEEQGASGEEQGSSGEEQKAASKKARSKRLRRICALAAAVVVVALVGTGVWAYAAGVITPANAAAKYGLFDYLDESEVTDYIMTYKEQMGYGDATDDEWATFLATYNLTPDRLRLSTIAQILADKAVEKRCAELGITASDDEVEAVINTLKSSLGLSGDDETWSATLELYGQSEEGLRETYRLELLKQKLCTEEVEVPTPTDDEVRSYIASFAASRLATETAEAASSEEAEEIVETSTGTLVKHSYCFTFKTSGDEISLDESRQVELVRQEFIESGLDVENFLTLLALYSNDEEAIEANGSMGWDADSSEYSEQYALMLETVEVGGLSSVFTDGDSACFIWVDQGYTVPYDESELEALDLDAMPASLYEYFSDCEAYVLWQEASDEYLNDLVASLDVTIYEMPSDAPYNVDMSAYLVSDDDSEDAGDDDADGDDAADAADAAGGDDADGDDADGDGADGGGADGGGDDSAEAAASG